MNEIRYASGFSGIGGFDLALDRIGGYKRVWSCDNNRYANQIYIKHFGEENHHSGDIEGVDPEDIPDFDLFCAGFPCQAFSVAGQRKGFEDTRGTLFFEICRITEAKRPSLLLLENVKGLLNHDRGRTFTIILQSLDELGYWLEWQVLNSKYFGVPQNRERVFIIGHLREGNSRPIFPITKPSEITNVRNTEEQVALALQSPGHASGNYRGMNMIIDGFNKSIREAEYSNSLKTNPSPTSSAVLAVLTPDRIKKRQHGRRIKELGDPSFTLTGQDIHGVYIQNIPHGFNEGWKKEFPNIRAHQGSPYNELLVKDAKIRHLTPIECERLQGFPDRWTEGVSDTQRYRVLGNAVTVNVIEFLGELIKSSFTNKEGTE